MTFFLAVVFSLMSLLLMFVVLIQRGRGGGLIGAFGGGGGGSAFGTKTGDVFTIVTVVLFVLFLLLAICLNLRVQPSNVAANAAAGAAMHTPPASGSPAPAASNP
ncbi:MAG TPA: preprotein translocase subunit SecG [Phycisphaerae bacterium]|nr:preprotein translocase subunit SecG [Phycisphaerae bacterium]